MKALFLGGVNPIVEEAGDCPARFEKLVYEEPVRRYCVPGQSMGVRRAYRETVDYLRINESKDRRLADHPDYVLDQYELTPDDYAEIERWLRGVDLA